MQQAKKRVAMSGGTIALFIAIALIVVITTTLKMQIHLHAAIPGSASSLITLNEGPAKLQIEAQKHDAKGEEDFATQDYQHSLLTPGFKNLPPRYRSSYRELVDRRKFAKEKNYLKELICHDLVFYWRPARMPIRIYIPGETARDGFSAIDKQYIIGALNTWVSVIPDKLSYVLVSEEKDGDMRFSQKHKTTELGPSRTALGHSVPIPEGRAKWGVGTISRVNIDIAEASPPVLTADGPGSQERQRVFLHEIGHALGLRGHSCNANDIMFFVSLGDEMPVRLSDRDRATLKAIYETPNLQQVAEHEIIQQSNDGNQQAIIRLTAMINELEPNTAQRKRKVFELTKKAADLGSVDAQVSLGYLYKLGEGVPRDFGKAVLYWERAAEQDSDAALLALARMYESGSGIQKNLVQAEYYYRRAIAYESTSAELEYADFLCYQKGDDRSVRLAMNHYRAAAQVLNSEAMARLSFLYAHGPAGSRNAGSANYWNNQALNVVASIKPMDAESLFMRGRIWKSLYRPGAAVADMVAAEKLNPKLKGLYGRRSSAYFALGDTQKALADLDKDIAENPDDGDMYLFRLICHLASDPLACSQDLAQIRKRCINPGSVFQYGLMYAALAAKMLHNDDQAIELASEAKKQSVRGYWPWPMLDYLSGKIDAQQLEQLSPGDDKGAEARAVIGMVKLATGDKTGGLESLRWVAENGDPRFSEHSLAVAVLNQWKDTEITKLKATEELKMVH